MEDYYQILGVQQSASDKEIKTAYKRLALQWHPDKNPNNADEASQKFKKIAEAYQILGNSQSRRDYNERLSSGRNFDNGSSSTSHQNHHRYNDDDFSSRSFSQTGAGGGPSADFFSFHFRSPEEIFSEFFGEDPFSDLFSDEFDPFFVGFGGHHFGGGGGGIRGQGRHNDTEFHENEFGVHLNLNFPGGQTYRTVVQPAATRIRTGTVTHSPPEPVAGSGSRRSRTRTKSTRSKTSSSISTDTRGASGTSGGIGSASGASRNSTVTCSSTTTRVVNGKRVTVQKKLENGVETTTVYEDDVITSRTIKNV